MPSQIISVSTGCFIFTSCALLEPLSADEMESDQSAFGAFSGAAGMSVGAMAGVSVDSAGAIVSRDGTFSGLCRVETS